MLEWAAFAHFRDFLSADAEKLRQYAFWLENSAAEQINAELLMENERLREKMAKAREVLEG